MPIPCSLLFLASVLLLLPACISGKSPTPRYFRPAPGEPQPERPALDQQLRFRGVKGASYLKERVVWRVSEVELGFYDLRRWLEPPPLFVDAALSRHLFEGWGLRRSGSPRAPSLEVELQACEVVLDPSHEVRLAARLWLFDPEGQALLERTFEAVRPVSGDDAADDARAVGAALDALAAEMAGAVVEALR